jgi:hypothetical protein
MTLKLQTILLYLPFYFQAPLYTNYSFTIENDCMEDCIGQGDSIEFIVKISTEQDKCHTPFEFLFPFVSSSSSKPSIAVCEYEILEIGRNLPCLAKDDIQSIETKYVLSRDLFNTMLGHFM